MTYRLILWLSLLMALHGCTKPKPQEYVLTAALRFGDNAEQIIEGLAGLHSISTTGTIYEGLPSRYSAAYESEKKRPDVTEFKGDDFYDYPSPLSNETSAALRRILGNEKTFFPLSQKDCDGFHADWAIVWDLGTDQIRFHLCFGCEEARVFYKEQSSRCDLDHAARDNLRALLTPFRKDDPKYTPTRERQP